jgi:hypothetical protein
MYRRPARSMIHTPSVVSATGKEVARERGKTLLDGSLMVRLLCPDEADLSLIPQSIGGRGDHWGRLLRRRGLSE